MSDFILYVKLGLNHVLDFNGYDHILFLIVLAVIYDSKQWKKLLWLVTFFTLGHTLTLGLAAYEVINVKIELVEFLIPVTILITALANVLRVDKASQGKEKLNLIFALLFGLIHGLGFSNFFRGMIGREEDKLLPLLEFAIGIEIAQVIIVLGILVFGSFLLLFTRIRKRDWVLVCSAIVMGIVLPMIQERVFW